MPFLRPEFFDIFGAVAFGLIVVFSIWGLKTNKPPPKWAFVVLLVVGILGFFVDGVIVYTTYLK